MVQDFAKIRPEPVLTRKAPVTPPAWSLLFAGVITGIAIGVFGCVLLYMSGNVPALPGMPPMTAAAAPGPSAPVPDPSEATAAPALELEFYQALSSYEVVIETTPVAVTAAEQTEGQLGAPVVLQIGAFERLANAETQRTQLVGMGVDVTIREEPRPGKVLYLVQSGPYLNADTLVQAEGILRRNSVSSRRISLSP